jgi:hypothetical protein
MYAGSKFVGPDLNYIDLMISYQILSIYDYLSLLDRIHQESEIRPSAAV